MNKHQNPFLNIRVALFFFKSKRKKEKKLKACFVAEVQEEAQEARLGLEPFLKSAGNQAMLESMLTNQMLPESSPDWNLQATLSYLCSTEKNVNQTFKKFYFQKISIL